MSNPTKPSTLERVTGNVVTESVLTTIAAVAGGPIAPLLPVLANSLAAKRQQARVEATLLEIQSALEAQEGLVRHLTDEQYKVVNEAISAVFHTTQEQKLRLLRNVVANTITTNIENAREATVLSRMVRDISADEVAFLSAKFVHTEIQIGESNASSPPADNILRISPKSADAAQVSGLLSLGILAPAESTWGGADLLRFTCYAGKLLAILRNRDA